MSNINLNQGLQQAWKQRIAKLRPTSARNISLLLAAISLGIGGSMAYDTFRGKRIEADAKLAHIKQQASMNDMMFGHGRYSQMPFMDRMAHKLFGFFEYGPFNMRIRWNEFKIQTGRTFDSIMDNAVPIGIGLGALYTGIGHRRIADAFGRMVSSISNGWNSRVAQRLTSDLRQIMGSAFRPVGDGLLKLGSLPFKSGPNFLVTAFSLLAGAFALNRFKDVYTGEHQDSQYRDVFLRRDF